MKLVSTHHLYKPCDVHKHLIPYTINGINCPWCSSRMKAWYCLDLRKSDWWNAPRKLQNLYHRDSHQTIIGNQTQESACSMEIDPDNAIGVTCLTRFLSLQASNACCHAGVGVMMMLWSGNSSPWSSVDYIHPLHKLLLLFLLYFEIKPNVAPQIRNEKHQS